MDALGWIIVAIIVVGLIALVAFALPRWRSKRLQDQFGPEYDRTLEEYGDRKRAEDELAERSRRRDEFEVQPLTTAQRERHTRSWQEIQKRFVDEPRAAVVEADRTIMAVMADEGYPVEDFDRRAADVSVDHPEVVEHYRAAHAISARSDDSRTSTEDLRQAFVHYRALFDELLDGQMERTSSRETDERNGS